MQTCDDDQRDRGRGEESSSFSKHGHPRNNIHRRAAKSLRGEILGNDFRGGPPLARQHRERDERDRDSSGLRRKRDVRDRLLGTVARDAEHSTRGVPGERHDLQDECGVDPAPAEKAEREEQADSELAAAVCRADVRHRRRSVDGEADPRRHRGRDEQECRAEADEDGGGDGGHDEREFHAEDLGGLGERRQGDMEGRADEGGRRLRVRRPQRNEDHRAGNHDAQQRRRYTRRAVATSRTPLPIDDVLERIVAELRVSRNLVVEAPPGAGKTTRVPPLLLDLVDDGREVWVLEPRRIAARAAARRVADEKGERLGETVGYTVRFDDVSGPKTRLRFVTEGILARRILSDRELDRIGAVVFDEFHERHIHADVGLALARRLQFETRPDLRIVAMSATLEAAPVAAFLGDCPVVKSEGRLFDVAIEYDARPDERPLADRVAGAVARIASDGLDGDVLVFLPGAAEIRRALDSCAAIARRAGADLLPLHGDLPAADQDRAVAPSTRPRIILSTNVAESSITIEGVVAVVDSGLARVPAHSPWTGLPTIETERVSRASADQRAGRAGRVRPGRCIRLYTSLDYGARPPHSTAEILRLDLAETALLVHGGGVARLTDFGWFEQPARSALDAADALLERLGAVVSEGHVTADGRAMLRLPIHPRLARLVLECASRGFARIGCRAAAVLSERDPRSRTPFEGAGRSAPSASGPSDVLAIVDLIDERNAGGRGEPGIDRGAVASIVRTAAQLERALGKIDASAHARNDTVDHEVSERALGIAVLSAFPDRVARRVPQARGGRDDHVMLALAAGATAELHPSSVVRSAEFMVAVDAETRRDPRGGWTPRSAGTPVVRTASGIESDWLIELFADRVVDQSECLWSETDERAFDVRRLTYDGLVIDETRRAAVPGPAAAAHVAAAARVAPAFLADPAIGVLLARIRFAVEAAPDCGLAPLTEADVDACLVEVCGSLTSLAQLRACMPAALAAAITRRAGPGAARALARFAPEKVRLARGREVRVHYAEEAPPWIASRLQDFFGMKATPMIGDGRRPLVVHLLAPNQRPVQVTSDLAGFWERHYPALRRELGRRYPKHAWPEDPLAGIEPPKSGPKGERRQAT